MPKTLKIAVIDDNPADAVILKRCLEKIEHFKAEPVHYLSWEEAREEVLADGFDCLLLDYRLGRLNGLEVLTEIQQKEAFTPVIFVTGHGDEMVAVEALKRGAQDYLVKSVINPSSLRRTITNAIEKSGLSRQIREKKQELEEFVHVVSHDLQQPLCAVKGNIELIRDFYCDRLDEKACEFVKSAIRMADRMSQMIEGLLAYSIVGRSGRPKKNVDLQSVLESVHNSLAELIHKNNAKISAGELPVVFGDELALSQLFQNLIANGIKFRGDEPPLISVQSRLEDGHCHIWISDNGIGIDPKDRDKIFLPFRRLHTETQYAGSGIGLALCKKIVDQHGGKIWVESAPGEGATFHFTLRTKTNDPGENYDDTGRQRRVLVVDDEPEVATMIQEALRHRGYVVDTAQSSEQAAKLLSDREFDLAITDLVIPGETNLDCVRMLRDDYPDLQVIAISGGGGEQAPGPLLREASSLGVTRVFSKPFETNKLALAVDELAT